MTATTDRYRHWTAAEDSALRAHYIALGARGAAALIGRSRSAVNTRAVTLGLTRAGRACGAWTAAEDALLLAAGPSAAARRLNNRSVDACYARLRALDGRIRSIPTRPHAAKPLPPRTDWTAAEDVTLAAIYTLRGADIASGYLPGRTPDDVTRRARALGLRHITRWMRRAA